MNARRPKRIYPTLCRECGEPVRVPEYEKHFRLCAKHLREARLASGPFACRSEDIGTPGESPADRGLCAECEHRHMPGEACTEITATMEFSYGELVKNIPPHACGCRA